jgi:subtilase family serine protease
VPNNDVGQGATSQSRSLQLTVTLQPADPSALAAYVTDVSTPGNSLYRHYLTPSQFASRFGAGSQTISDVRASLSAQGLKLGPTAVNGLSIPATGSVGTAQKAFDTSFDNYSLPSGRTAYANTTAPSLPTAIAGDVQSVLGLDDLHQSSAGPAPAKALAATHAATAAKANAEGGAVWNGSCPDFDNDWTADQLATAYSTAPLSDDGLNGDGVTVGLYELSTYDPSDVETYEGCYDYDGGNPDPSIGDVTVDGGALDDSGSGEVTLDIEDVLGLAPGANIVVYEGPNSGPGAYDTYSQMISDDTMQVISTSWGLCETYEGKPGASAQNTLFQEAAVQGQTILAAAGDFGSSDCEASSSSNHNLAVDDPASQPYVTGVGGTDLTSLSPTETVWNQPASHCPSQCSGGGGISKFWTMPTWQQSAVIDDSSGSPCGAATGSYCRQVPDVTASASGQNGYLIFWDGDWYVFRGTSAAAPLWAAFIAQADQCAAAAGPVGFINPVLYQHPADLNDVTTGNNHINSAVPTGDWTAHTGYDLASGLGSPDGSALLSDFCSPAVQPTVSSVSPSSGSTSGGTSVTINGSGFTGATAVTFGGTAAAGVSVKSDTKITATSPAHGAATTNVRVSGPGGQSAVVTPADQFTYALPKAVPVVSSVSPSSGSTAGGTSVTITGSGFTGATAVSFGGAAATSVVVKSGTKITATSPAHAATTTNVRVTGPGGQSAVVTPADQFTYAALPVVSGVSPASGALGGGTTVTVSGSGFTGASEVAFGGVAGADVVVKSDTKITVTSPAHAAGATNVRVTTAFGQSAVVSADQFTYQAQAPKVTKLSPKSGPVAGGTSVTVTGAGFAPDATVSFGSGNVAESVTYVSSTELIAVSPPHAATASYVNVTVTTGAGTSAAVTADQYKYV